MINLKTNFVDYGLEFTSLQERSKTDLIVIHHTGNPKDDNLSAEEIHASHLNRGWAGCGYHFVIRKNGEVEIGRPMDCTGAHAEGENYHTIGIMVCGNFEIAEPTDQQIEALAKLINDITDYYGLANTEECVVGHKDLMATACPGNFLYKELKTVLGKAEFYRLN